VCSSDLVTTTMPVEVAAQQIKSLGFADGASCNGKRPCVLELARQLQVGWIFSVSLSRIAKERSIGVELIDVADGSTLEKDGFVLGAKDELTPALLATFAANVKKRLPAPKPDVPVAVVTTPKEPPVDLPPPPPPPPEPAPAPRAHTAGWVMAGLAAGALIGSGVTLALGLNARGSIQRSITDGVSTLSRSAALSLNTQANTQFIVSAVLGGLALALGTVAVIVW
jgi:hypothetical protein